MSFADFGLLPGLLEALELLNIKEGTPVQRLAIPAVLGGKSVFVVARTGSGKTLAYAVPLVQRLHIAEQLEGAVTQKARPRALVLTSTRELVDQTVKVLKSVSHGVRARVRGVNGGMLPSEVNRRLVDPVDILVGNPTRIATMVREARIDLTDLRMLVVDEADTLLSPGQRPDLEFLMDQPGDFPRCYFSATLPEPMRQMMLARPEKPVLLLSKDAHSAPDKVKVQNLNVRTQERLDATHDVLSELPKEDRGILFCNRRETAAEVATALRERGHSLQIVQGGMLPRERVAAMKAFREGDGRFLVTTELGGRGLHIDNLKWVLNYELPPRPSEYLHRIGRVGRAGGPGGRVINLITPFDTEMAAEIKRLAGGSRLDTGEALRGPRAREAAVARKDAREEEERRVKARKATMPKVAPDATKRPPQREQREAPLPGGRRGRPRRK